MLVVCGCSVWCIVPFQFGEPEVVYDGMIKKSSQNKPIQIKVAWFWPNSPWIKDQRNFACWSPFTPSQVCWRKFERPPSMKITILDIQTISISQASFPHLGSVPRFRWHKDVLQAQLCIFLGQINQLTQLNNWLVSDGLKSPTSSTPTYKEWENRWLWCI